MSKSNWVSTLAKAMAVTGNGYRHHSLRNTGNFKYAQPDAPFPVFSICGRDCRKDKAMYTLPLSKVMRGYRKQYDSPRAK